MTDRRKALFLFTTALLAFAARIVPYRTAFLGGNIIFNQPDAYYHLRRATLIVKNFPVYPTLDRYMAYPYGAESPWPPLYDWVIGVISLIAGLGKPGDTTILVVTTLLPPLLGALTVVPVFLVARQLFGERPAVFAAIFAVVMPGQLGYSIIGSGDHHTAEVFLLLYSFHFFLKGRAGERAMSPDPGWRSEIVSGLFLAIAVLVWQGSIVFGTILVLYAMARLVVLRIERREGADEPIRVTAGTTAVLLTAAALVALVRAVIRPGTEQGVFDFGFFSFFQPVYLLMISGFLWGAWFLLFAGGKERRRTVFWAAGVLAAGAAGILLLAPGMMRNILEGIRFLLRRHPYLASISEFQPLYTGNPLLEIFKGRFFERQFWEALYMAGFVLPLYLVYIRWRERKTRLPEVADLFFALWTVLFFALTVLQRRWGNAYSANIAIGVGWFFARLFEKSGVLSGAWREFLEWRERHKGAERPRSIFARVFIFSGRSPWIVASACFFFFLIPYQQLIYSWLVLPGLPIDADAYNSLVWLRLNTPPTSHLYSPAKQPEYAIMSQWDVGHWIQYIAERPTVANNYGYQLRGDGLGDSVRFVLSRNEEEAVRICEKRGVRFVFATDAFMPIQDLAKIVGVDFLERYVGPPIAHPGGGLIPVPREEFYSLFYQRMYYFDGCTEFDSAALQRFRLIFESKNGTRLPFAPRETKKVKIYEFVRGAAVKGRGAPSNTRVTCAVRMQTNWGREFDYVSAATSDAKGNFTMRIPYASRGDNYFIHPLSRFLAIGGDRAKFFDISEDDVLKGREVAVDLRRGGLTMEKHRSVGNERHD